MIDKDNASLLQGVIVLLEDKQQNPGNSDIETQFFNEALAYLLNSNVDHWWCNESTLAIARESLWLFSLPDHNPIVQYKNKLNEQLTSCVQCAQSYQLSKRSVQQRYNKLFPKKTVEDFFNCIDRFDIARVKATFRQHEINFSMTTPVMCGLLEAICSPHLLEDQLCDDLFCKMFQLIQQTGSFPTFGTEICTHIFRMTLHHHRVVRFWARKLIEKFTTAERYKFSEEDFMLTKDLILGVLKSFMEDSDDEYFTVKMDSCSFEITQDLGELWKGFRLVTCAASPEMLQRCLMEADISMPELIRIQLSSSAECLGEILKTMTAMLLKMQAGFWGKIGTDAAPYYDIVKQICEHVVFQTAMKIAREGNTGKILQRDGSRYPDDKLMAKIKSMLEWIYPYWSSLRHSSVEKEITQKILDTTFGYFQANTWGVMSRAYCAELGLQIIDQCLADDSVPVEKINAHISQIVGFAKTNPQTLPALVQHMPVVARNILSDLVDRDFTCLNKAFNTVYQIDDDLTDDIETGSAQSGDDVQVLTAKSPYEPIWNSIKSCFDQDVKGYPWLAKLLFKAYANIASADISSYLTDDESANDEETSRETKQVLDRLSDIRSIVSKTLGFMSEADWEVRKFMLVDSELSKAMFHFISMPQKEIRQSFVKFMQQKPRTFNNDQDVFSNFFQVCHPLQVLEGFNSMLREFIALTSSPQLNMFKAASNIAQFLLLQADMLTCSPKGYLHTLIQMGPDRAKDEDEAISEFWDVCWRSISVILEKSLLWARNYKPVDIAGIVVPVLDTATHMVNARKLFEMTISLTSKTEEVTLNHDNINTTADSLSHWIYVTRQDMISRLVPLTLTILAALQEQELKVSFGAYDRLMTAATGVNSSRLTVLEKKDFFDTLKAHEPTNFIFLDDSDDEVEWQPVNLDIPRPTTVPASLFTSASTSTSSNSSMEVDVKKSSLSTRQLTLDQSFSNVSLNHKDNTPNPTYYHATATQPHEISDNGEFDEEFGDLDYSQVPEEWLEVKTEPTDVSPSLALAAAKQPSRPVFFGDNESVDIIEVPKVKPTAKPAPVKITPFANRVEPKPRPNMNRVHLPEPKQPTFAVTSKGRKLRPPSMGFSKIRNMREEHRAERRFIATAKSPSAAGMVRKHYGVDDDSGSSAESSSDEEGDQSGMHGLIYSTEETVKNKANSSVQIVDVDKNAANVQAEKASVLALFDTKPKRTIKLLETPITNEYLGRKLNAKAMETARRQKVTPSIDRFFKTLLSWDITDTREIPPHTNENMFNHVPSTFKNFDEYRSTFEPLLMLETWCQLLRAKEGLTQNDVMDRCLVSGRCHVNDFVDVTFNMPMNVVHNKLSPDDLICVANHFGPAFFTDPYSNSNSSTVWRGKAFMGKVMAINQRKNTGEVVVRCFFTSDRISILNSISPKTIWHILKIMSLTTTLREYAALEGLQYYDLGKEIIQPKPTVQQKPSQAAIEQYRERYDVNEPQAEAIVSAIQKKKGFSLIQGPPGTGKTKTILSLIVSLLDQRTTATKDQPYGTGKLLVCAPSNAAVDEIAKRLKEGVTTSHGIRTPNVVRIGVADSVNASVKDRILDRLIEAEMDASGGRHGSASKWSSKLDTYHSELRTLQILLDDADREISQAGDDMEAMSILREKRKALGSKLNKIKILLKDTYQDQKNHGKEMEVSRVRARQKVFANADVVCATLSGAGHDMLTAMGVSFETVIVDEAAQSIEISSLIPLKFDTQRCILVGDPNQLPPTVMSTLATKYDYQQSLFMRLEHTIAKEINLLSIQYRMHPDISQLPSKLFYQSRLLDGPSMDKVSSAAWHDLPEFPPYRFFNIVDGQEQVGRGKSIYNVAESDAAVALVDMLCTKLPTMKFASKIGIITPYKQQVGQLKSKFTKRFGSNVIDVIDFNTVDGFQGQEKEIIIFSCVRAGSGRGIGFLADMRRMNVGLTRAKCSLFVLGHARSLANSEYWGDLVRDAERRSLITNCQYPYFRHKINEFVVPKNIFDKSTIVIKKKAVTYKRGPVKIAQPKSHSNSASSSDSDDVDVQPGQKRRAHTKPASGVRKRKVLEQDVVMKEASVNIIPNESSFLEKVRREKERKMQQQKTQVPISPPRDRLTMAEYRASRGLPPLIKLSNPVPPTITASRMMPRQTSNGSVPAAGSNSLFIKKKPALSKPKPTSIWPEGMGAKERANIEHAAAKERLKNAREEEKRRDNPYARPPPVIQDLDTIMSETRNKYSHSSSSDQRNDYHCSSSSSHHRSHNYYDRHHSRDKDRDRDYYKRR